MNNTTTKLENEILRQWNLAQQARAENKRLKSKLEAAIGLIKGYRAGWDKEVTRKILDTLKP